MKTLHGIVLLFALVLLVVAVCGRNRVESFPDWEPQIVIELIRKGYTPMDTSKPPVEAVSLPGVSTVLHGAGVAVLPDSVAAWPDSLPVEIAVVDVDGYPWIGAWVNGVPVAWTEAPRIAWPDSKPSPISAVCEYAFVSGNPWGVGAAWEPVTVSGYRAGLCATVDTDTEWAAVSARVSRRWGPLSVGGDLGYRFGDIPGLHVGVSAGLAIDL